MRGGLTLSSSLPSGITSPLSITASTPSPRLCSFFDQIPERGRTLGSSIDSAFTMLQGIDTPPEHRLI
jgi:hypothetical protein